MKVMIPFSPKETGKLNVSWLVALLGILTAFAPLSTDMYLAAFPVMAKDMGTDVGRIQLSLSIFFFGLAIGQLIYGPLSDRFGRRRPLLAGLLVFSLASFGLVLVRDIRWFLVLRFIQALGGCAGMIVSRAIIRDIFNLEKSARVLTIMMAVQSIGPVAAPIMGGYLLRIASWDVIFILLTLIGLVCLLITFLTLPESLPEEKRLKQTLGKVFAVFFILIRKKEFIVPTLAGAFGASAMFAFISGSPFVLMSIYGLNEIQYGWAFGSICLGTAVLAQSNIFFLEKFTAKSILMVCLVCLMACSTVLTLFVVCFGQPPLAFLMIMVLLSLMGVPVVGANATAVAMASSGKYSGSASSLIGMLQFAFAGLFSSLVSMLHDGSVLPMVGMMMICGLLALLVVFINRMTEH